MMNRAGCALLGLGLGIVGAIASSGCTDSRAFTDEQRAILQGFGLSTLPPDASNKYADNPAAAVLGKKWYFDPRMSGAMSLPNDGKTNGSLGAVGESGKVSCASCHDPFMGDPVTKAPGRGGSDHRSRPAQTSLGATYSVRNAHSTLNAAYVDLEKGAWQTWDGRADSLWAGNLLPLERSSSNNATRLQLAHVVFDHYRTDYEAIFDRMPELSDTTRFPLAGKPGDAAFDNMAAVDRDAINRVFANIGKAIAAYERRLVSTAFEPSAFDQMLAGDDSKMTPGAIRGARLFVGKAACDECHRGPAFMDEKFHNIGVPQVGEHVPDTDLGRFDGVPLVKASVFTRAGTFSDAPPDDSHLRNLTQTDAQRGEFKTPTLRNVALTGPYMHDGVYATLGEVVHHYNIGGATGNYAGTREVTISPLLLDDSEEGDLVEFLLSLTDGLALKTADFPEGLVAPPTFPN